MNEYGVKESWTRQLTVTFEGLHANRFVGCGKNEKLFFAYNSTMHLYNLQQVKPLHDDILEADDSGHSCVHCRGGYWS